MISRGLGKHIFKCARNSLHLKRKSNYFFSLDGPNLSINSPTFYTKGRLKLHYSKWGKGRHILFVFHGFGLSYLDMISFTSHWENDFTCYGFDLPYHGANEKDWNQRKVKPYSEEEFAQFFDAFADDIGAKTFSVLGYSLGGRMSLKLSELLPDRVTNIYLFAPDGLKKSKWYVMFNHNFFGRAIFRFFIKHYRFFFKLAERLRKLGLISNNLMKFVQSNTATRDMQWQVYFLWTGLRHLDPNWKKMIKAWEKHPKSVDVFLGYHDRVIPPSHAKKIERDYPTAIIHVFPSGHFILTDKNAELIIKNNWLRLPESGTTEN